MKILFSLISKKQLKKLDLRIQQKILFTLEKFGNNEAVDIIKMRGSLNDYRIRVGKYRIQLQKMNEGFVIIKIAKRENFYLIFF